MPDPELPDDAVFSQLDRDVRGRLRTLSKGNAERVGRHLVMVGRLLDVDPESAYEHAQAAVRRAGRVDVVREAAGLAAYRTGRYAEALRELRTVRRLNGSSEHLPVMADAERGLGRPERAIALAHEPEAQTLTADQRVELAIVVSGARLDLGQPEAALAAVGGDAVAGARGLVAARVALARAAALEALGRTDDAAVELAPFGQDELDAAQGGSGADEDVVVYDLADDVADAPQDDPDARAAGTHATQDPSAHDDGPDGDAPDQDAPAEDATPADASADDASADGTPGGAASDDGPDGPAGQDTITTDEGER